MIACVVKRPMSLHSPMALFYKKTNGLAFPYGIVL
jgi:hypothetical protein